MISAHLLAVFLAALLVVYAVPGPDMALLLQTSIGRGVRSGFAAAAGLALARATHVTLSACGVAALLRNAPWLYDVVRYGGALYLAWVGVQIFRSPVFSLPDGKSGTGGTRGTRGANDSRCTHGTRGANDSRCTHGTRGAHARTGDVSGRRYGPDSPDSSDSSDNSDSAQRTHALRAAFVKGLLTNLLNPKALLFCSVLLPQFVRPEAGPVLWQMAELGVVLVAVGASFDTLCALGAARIARWVRAHPLAQTLQRWTFSAALIGFALRLSLD